MSELTIRIFSQYIIQGAWAVILALLFLYTYKIYKKHYLKLWSWSWWAFSAYMVSASLGLTALSTYPLEHPFRIFLSAISISFAYIQVSLLLVGTWELVKNKKFYIGRLRLILYIAVALALLSSLLYIGDPQPSAPRFFVRVSLRSFITGTGFFITGIWMIRNLSYDKSLGKHLLIFAFLAFGFEQLNYFIVGLLPFVNISFNTSYIPYLGLLDFFLEALVGMGMAIWLLQNERKELEKANTDLDTFFYSTSHDLRSPIASIIGLTSLAKVQIKDTDALEYFEKIEGRVNKLDAVINDILSYAKSVKHHLKTETIDFNDILDEVKTVLEFNDGAKQIELLYEHDQKNTLVSDKMKMTTILNNLLSNAIRYHDLSKTNRYIKITFEKDSGVIIINVEDNGLGIAHENKHRIFEMFYRASGDSVGSGLGLYIVKEAVKKLNGDVTVTSILGKGTTFTIRLPMMGD